jgi:hypothetical protein
MALTVRKITHSMAFALVSQLNAFLKSFVTNNATLAYPHFDTTSLQVASDYTTPSSTPLQVTAATAVDLPSTITLAENLRSVMQAMMGDTLAHKASDATNLALITLTAAPLSVDLPSVEIVLNAEKAALNAHFTQSGIHAHSDTTNTVSTAAATTLTTAEALANALTTAVNAHIVFSPGSILINLVAG